MIFFFNSSERKCLYNVSWECSSEENNSVLQIGAIISGIQPGLTMVVGPPGTGKTDTAVQILNVLYHNCPSQRTLIITHSNQALNDLFEKIMQVNNLFLSEILCHYAILMLTNTIECFQW